MALCLDRTRSEEDEHYRALRGRRRLCSAPIRGGTRLHHEAGQPEPLDEIVSGLI